MKHKHKFVGLSRVNPKITRLRCQGKITQAQPGLHPMIQICIFVSWLHPVHKCHFKFLGKFFYLFQKKKTVSFNFLLLQHYIKKTTIRQPCERGIIVKETVTLRCFLLKPNSHDKIFCECSACASEQTKSRKLYVSQDISI